MGVWARQPDGLYRRSRHLALNVLLIVALPVWATGPPAGADPHFLSSPEVTTPPDERSKDRAVREATPVPAVGQGRVRSMDEALRLAIRDGHDRSPTFRALVDRIVAHKGMVLVHWAPGLTAGLDACLLHEIVVTSNGGRVLWVLVKHNEPSDRLVALLAHELQHVLEVLDAGVSDGADMEELFQRVGWRTGSHGLTRRLPIYETDAAHAVQERVKRELRTTLPAGRGNAR